MELVASLAFCSALVVWAGSRLSLTVIQLANTLSIVKGWLGVLIILLITSLPELCTTISSVSFVHSADMAFGNVLGSCAFNLVMLAFMHLLFVKGNKSGFNRLSSTQVISLSLAIIMLVLTGTIVARQNDFLTGLEGIYGIIGMGIVIMLLSRIIKYRRTAEEEDKSVKQSIGPSSSHSVILRIAIFATITIAAAWLLPLYIMEMAVRTGLGTTITSTFILAIVTSLPKISVALILIKYGAMDKAGDILLHTNVLLLVLLGLSSVFFQGGGNLFLVVSQNHGISIIAVLLMTSVTMVGVIRKQFRKQSSLTVEVLITIVVYYGFMAILYRAAR